MSGKKVKIDAIPKEGKRSKPDVSPCDIKTSELFHANYAGHKINEAGKTFQCTSGWNSAEGRQQIKAWLRVVAKDQVRMYGRIRRNSEAALYPLIITTLLPVFDLCDCTATGTVSQDIPREELEHIAGEIAESQSRRSSRQVSTEGGQSATESDPPNLDDQPDQPDLPDLINTAVESDVLKFMVYIEKWLASAEYATKGRVEILISNSVLKMTVCVIEAKPHISNDEPNDAGFFQCCAYMALQNIPFGIFTDHKTFQFIRMDEKKILHRTKLFDLMQSEYDSFNATAPSVYAHLFEVMGVPRSTDLLASAAASAATWADRAAEMIAGL